jgi:hypothetical protein
MKQKYLGQCHVSFDYLHKLFGFPNEVEIVRVEVNDITGSIVFILQSKEEVSGYTFPTMLGAIPPRISHHFKKDNDDDSQKYLPTT